MDGMSSLVIDLLRNGWSDEQVCVELGLEKEELLRYKHITGYAAFYEQAEFSKAAMSDKQIAEKLRYQKESKEVDNV